MSESFTPRQEDDRVDRRATWLTAIAFVLMIALGVAVAGGLLAKSRRPSPPLRAPPSSAPAQIGILEQTSIEDTRRGIDLEREQRAKLEHYGWVDRDHGVARIPIDRAIDLVIADGGT
jgi:hypothetical protein